jgi:hypothetical protein
MTYHPACTLVALPLASWSALIRHLISTPPKPPITLGVSLLSSRPEWSDCPRICQVTLVSSKFGPSHPRVGSFRPGNTNVFSSTGSQARIYVLKYLSTTSYGLPCWLKQCDEDTPCKHCRKAFPKQQRSVRSREYVRGAFP